MEQRLFALACAKCGATYSRNQLLFIDTVPYWLVDCVICEERFLMPAIFDWNELQKAIALQQEELRGQPNRPEPKFVM